VIESLSDVSVEVDLYCFLASITPAQPPRLQKRVPDKLVVVAGPVTAAEIDVPAQTGMRCAVLERLLELMMFPVIAWEIIGFTDGL
jgi:hypothetical protein